MSLVYWPSFGLLCSHFRTHTLLLFFLLFSSASLLFSSLLPSVLPVFVFFVYSESSPLKLHSGSSPPSSGAATASVPTIRLSHVEVCHVGPSAAGTVMIVLCKSTCIYSEIITLPRSNVLYRMSTTINHMSTALYRMSTTFNCMSTTFNRMSTAS